MSTKLVWVMIAVAAFLGSCASNQPGAASNKKESINTGYSESDPRTFTGSAGVLENPDQAITLTDHLRRVPGVIVNGSGAGATIRIGGPATSINSNSDPLFIVNGSQMPNYASAYEVASGTKIKSVTVLKDPNSTSMYGTRGANGVVLIVLD